ncbi:hypothetical protein TW86_20845 [Halomonas sp. S2151]|nr:hypothetical protein TW86_20845 [Halomonas sp. S2151]
MQKPRMSKQCVNGIVYWRCMGYPTLNGEAITGTGETPREAWRDYCHRFYEYVMVEHWSQISCQARADVLRCLPGLMNPGP